MQNKVNCLVTLLVFLALIGCSSNPPPIENIHLKSSIKYFVSTGGRVTSDADYIEKYELNSSENYGDTSSLDEDFSLLFNISRRFKYFAIGAGTTNFNPYLHISGIIPDIASISPYVVFSFGRERKLLPGVIAGFTPIKYLGFKSAFYIEYNHTDVEACGTYIGPCGLGPIGPYWIIDHGVSANIPLKQHYGASLASINIGVKRQFRTDLYSFYLQLAYQISSNDFRYRAAPVSH